MRDYKLKPFSAVVATTVLLTLLMLFKPEVMELTVATASWAILLFFAVRHLAHLATDLPVVIYQVYLDDTLAFVTTNKKEVVRFLEELQIKIALKCMDISSDTDIDYVHVKFRVTTNLVP